MQDRHQRTAQPFPQLRLPWLEIWWSWVDSRIYHMLALYLVDQAMTYAEKGSIASSYDSMRQNAWNRGTAKTASSFVRFVSYD